MSSRRVAKPGLTVSQAIQQRNEARRDVLRAQSNAHTLRLTRDDLAMLVRRLLVRLPVGDDVRVAAADYLATHGLSGRVVRGDPSCPT